MIKFFRHIRKSLLMENKTGKYFKYAIGEIILVVIGILIALQINNWNENSKETEQLRNILTRVTQDFDNNSSEITYTLKTTKENINFIDNINKGLVSKDSLRNDNDYFNKYIIAFSGFEDIKINTDGIDLLKTKIQNNYDLNNDSIEALFKLYTEILFEIEVDESELARAFINLSEYITSTGSFFELDIKGDKRKLTTMLLEDNTFKIYLNEYRYVLEIYLTKLDYFQKQGEELMTKIKTKYGL